MTNFLSNGVDLGAIINITSVSQNIPSAGQSTTAITNYLFGGQQYYALGYPLTTPPTPYTYYACQTRPTNILIGGIDLCQIFCPIYYLFTVGQNGNFNLSVKCTKIFFVLIGNGGYGGSGNGSNNGGSGGGGGSVWGYITIPSNISSCNVAYDFQSNPGFNVSTYYNPSSGPSQQNVISVNAYNGTNGSSTGGSGTGGGVSVNTSYQGGMSISYTAGNGGNGSASNYNYVSSGYTQNVTYPFAPIVSHNYGIGGAGSPHNGQGSNGYIGIMQFWVVY